MVNTLTVARVAEEMTKDGVTWRILDTSTPGHCNLVPWCDGLCEDLEPGDLGADHGRDVAAALVDGEPVVEICVGQWVVDPAQAWIDTGTLWRPNRDKAPTVSIHTHGGRPQGVFLEEPWGRTIAEALHLVGHSPFADALDAGAALAGKVEAARREAEEQRQEDRS